ncbi:MAG: septal ring lytic transglycosylase RlpA family protein [Geminicoccaceae bacterium]
MTQDGLWHGFRSLAGLLPYLVGLGLFVLAGCQSGGHVAKATSVKVGKPYQINGEWYYPRMVDRYRETGVASWYGVPFHGRKTANGEVYDMHGMTAAHPTLPLPSVARVTNLENGRSITVRVNDRGPFAKKRIIDLSRRAAWELGFKDQGTAEVEVVYLGLADGLDSRHVRSRQRDRVAALD